MAREREKGFALVAAVAAVGAFAYVSFQVLAADRGVTTSVLARVEQARLAALLSHDGELEALNSELGGEIRAGRLTLATPGLADHLWCSTMEKLAIDQPTYASYRRLLEGRK